MSNYNDENTSDNAFIIDQNGKSFLLETCKWAKFLSILGFIAIGFMVIGGLLFGTAMSSMSGMSNSDLGNGAMALSGGFIAILYIIIALIYAFPLLYLYKFATKTKSAVLNGDTRILNSGLEYLKKHYKFIGIFATIFLVIYAIVLVFSIIAGTAAFF